MPPMILPSTSEAAFPAPGSEGAGHADTVAEGRTHDGQGRTAVVTIRPPVYTSARAPVDIVPLICISSTTRVCIFRKHIRHEETTDTEIVWRVEAGDEQEHCSHVLENAEALQQHLWLQHALPAEIRPDVRPAGYIVNVDDIAGGIRCPFAKVYGQTNSKHVDTHDGYYHIQHGRFPGDRKKHIKSCFKDASKVASRLHPEQLSYDACEFIWTQRAAKAGAAAPLLALSAALSTLPASPAAHPAASTITNATLGGLRCLVDPDHWTSQWLGTLNTNPDTGLRRKIYLPWIYVAGRMLAKDLQNAEPFNIRLGLPVQGIRNSAGSLAAPQHVQLHDILLGTMAKRAKFDNGFATYEGNNIKRVTDDFKSDIRNLRDYLCRTRDDADRANGIVYERSLATIPIDMGSPQEIA